MAAEESICININEAVCWLDMLIGEHALVAEAEHLLERIGQTIARLEPAVEYVEASANTQPMTLAGLCCQFKPLDRDIPEYLADHEIETTQWEDCFDADAEAED